MNHCAQFYGTRFWHIEFLDEALVELARVSARRAQKCLAARKQVRRWQTLPPRGGHAALEHLGPGGGIAA